MKKITFETEGMSCFTCENRVKTAMLYLDGVHSCEANCTNGKIICEYDEDVVSIEKISDAIREMGYKII